MAEIKNFGLSGVGPDLQLGKSGPRLIENGPAVEAWNSNASQMVVVRAAPGVNVNEVVVMSQLDNLSATLSNAITNSTVTNGFDLALGNGSAFGDSWSGGAVALSDTGTVSDAVDKLNNILGKLVPASPPNFPNGTLSVTGTSGSSPVLASGVTDYDASGITAGSAVTRITGALSSNTFSTVGPGNTGTLSLLIDGATVGSHTLTGTGDNGTYGGLVIAGQAAYPSATPGFWQSVNVSVSGAAVANPGVHGVKLTDNAAGNTNTVFFVKDGMTSNPAVTLATVAQNAAGTLSYSSSVPHYNTGASLTIGGSISNLAGQTYYNGNPLSVSGSNGIFGTQAFSYGNVGIATPIAQNTTAATAITPVTVNVNPSNAHAVGQITLSATNVNGSGSQTINTTNILVQNGTTGGVDELNVPVSSLGSLPNNNNAVRVGMAGGNTPSDAFTTWVQSAALNTWDAAVVAGVLSCNQTNYSTGYLPVGPNLSGQAAAQYVTFAFERTALSQFIINVTGSFAGCWIALPGVSDNAAVSPHALGGAWWNAFAAYNGAGVPGFSADPSAGCGSGTLMTGASGSFTITFGTASSTSATGNTILVRFRLNAGQSITALSFS